MSATLIWQPSGLGAKTGVANANLITDLATLVDSKLADGNFAWRTASSSTAGPLYLVLKRKDGSVGRILLVIWAAAPAGNNVAILDQAPTTSCIYTAYFPAGNVDTPSNLTAASGTIMGDDTNAVKVSAGQSIATVYAASWQPFYFDTSEVMFFFFQNPASNTLHGGAAGNIAIDGADNVYPGVVANTTTAPWTAFGAPSSNAFAWNTGSSIAGNNAACMRINYGSNNKIYYTGMMPSGVWANSVPSANDILVDTSAQKVYFVPCQLVGMTRGEGFVLKLRQMAFGPGSLSAFPVYQSAGAVVQARQPNACASGSNGVPWLLNFKI